MRSIVASRHQESAGRRWRGRSFHEGRRFATPGVLPVTDHVVDLCAEQHREVRQVQPPARRTRAWRASSPVSAAAVPSRRVQHGTGQQVCPHAAVMGPSIVSSGSQRRQGNVSVERDLVSTGDRRLAARGRHRPAGIDTFEPGSRALRATRGLGHAARRLGPGMAVVVAAGEHPLGPGSDAAVHGGLQAEKGLARLEAVRVRVLAGRNQHHHLRGATHSQHHGRDHHEQPTRSPQRFALAGRRHIRSISNS